MYPPPIYRADEKFTFKLILQYEEKQNLLNKNTNFDVNLLTV